jgi:hypothetical protein
MGVMRMRVEKAPEPKIIVQDPALRSMGPRPDLAAKNYMQTQYRLPTAQLAALRHQHNYQGLPSSYPSKDAIITPLFLIVVTIWGYYLIKSALAYLRQPEVVFIDEEAGAAAGVDGRCRDESVARLGEKDDGYVTDDDTDDMWTTSRGYKTVLL